MKEECQTLTNSEKLKIMALAVEASQMNFKEKYKIMVDLITNDKPKPLWFCPTCGATHI